MKIVVMYRTAMMVQERKLTRYEHLIHMFNAGEHFIDENDRLNTYSVIQS